MIEQGVLDPWWVYQNVTPVQSTSVFKKLDYSGSSQGHGSAFISYNYKFLRPTGFTENTSILTKWNFKITRNQKCDGYAQMPRWNFKQNKTNLVKVSSQGFPNTDILILKCFSKVLSSFKICKFYLHLTRVYNCENSSYNKTSTWDPVDLKSCSLDWTNFISVCI